MNIKGLSMESLLKAVRTKVSADKQRHVEDGFDLDLTYITDRIIGTVCIPFLLTTLCSWQCGIIAIIPQIYTLFFSFLVVSPLRTTRLLNASLGHRIIFTNTLHSKLFLKIF
jgi:hypothetical protein